MTSEQRFFTLQSEAALLLLTALAWAGASLWVSFNSVGQVAHLTVTASFVVWFVWFLAWASKGGMPRGFH